MRKINVLLAIGVMAILSALLTGCGKAKADLVNGITPVSDAMAGIRPTLEELRALPAEQRTARLKQNYPRLEQDITYYLHRVGKLRQDEVVERVEFYFGSLKKARAEDKAGQVHDGFFDNQLLAKVSVRGRSEPVTVIVQCLNGAFLLPGDYEKMQSLGSYPVQVSFTIEPRQGLVRYVDYPVAIDIAARHGLRLYRGRNTDEKNRITVAQARLMESDTDRVQVTVYVVTGDKFDLAANTYVPSPQRR